MKQLKHTPLPWKVYYAKNNGQLVLGTGEENGQAIQNHNGSFWRDEKEAKANAEFVVKACNSHYELLEALESCERWFKLHSENVELTNGKYTQHPMLTMIQDTIAKAKGE
jgi:hypothetical protein